MNDIIGTDADSIEAWSTAALLAAVTDSVTGLLGFKSGIRPNLVGTPEQIAKGILEFADVGVDQLLLQCSPQLEELERFSKQVMPKVEELRKTATNI